MLVRVSDGVGRHRSRKVRARTAPKVSQAIRLTPVEASPDCNRGEAPERTVSQIKLNGASPAQYHSQAHVYLHPPNNKWNAMLGCDDSVAQNDAPPRRDAATLGSVFSHEQIYNLALPRNSGTGELRAGLEALRWPPPRWRTTHRWLQKKRGPVLLSKNRAINLATTYSRGT